MKRLITACAASGLLAAAIVTPAAADAPPASTCFSYSSDQWVQVEFTATPGACSSAHNGEVLGQVTVPADIAAAGYGSDQVRSWAFQACQPVAVNYAWTAAKSKYPKASYTLPRSARLNVQFPSAQAWAQGQQWAACLGQSRNEKLTKAVNRTGSVKGKGLKPYVCLSPQNWKGTKCSKPDAVRLTNQTWLAKSYVETYPGSNPLLKRAGKACKKMRKKGWTLRTWYVPGLSAWERGNKYGFCEFVK